VSKPAVVVTHPVLEPAPALLEDACEVRQLPNVYKHPVEKLRQAAEGVQGMLTQLMDEINEEVLSAPGLKCVSNVAVGFDNIDVAAATKHGVLVTNTPVFSIFATPDQISANERQDIAARLAPVLQLSANDIQAPLAALSKGTSSSAAGTSRVGRSTCSWGTTSTGRRSAWSASDASAEASPVVDARSG